MTIPDRIRENHRQLSTASFNFLDFVERNPGILKRSGFNILESHQVVGKLQSWPAFINQHTEAKLEEAGTSVFKLYRNIPQRIFQNNPEAIAQYYNMPLDIIKKQLASIDEEQVDNLLARGDFMFTDSGLKCMEYNVTANIGGLQISFWEQMYANIPIIAKFLDEQKITPDNRNAMKLLMAHFIKNAVKKFPEKTDINLAMVIPKFTKGEMLMENQYINRIFKSILQQEYDKTGSVIFCDWGHLTTRSDSLFYDNKTIHIVMEMYHGIIPEEILNVHARGNITLFDGPATIFFSSKLHLAALSRHADTDLYTPEEKEIIHRFVPWTRKIVPGDVTFQGDTVKLEEFIYSNREGLVIKPQLGKSGEGVYLGKNTPPAEWDNVVRQAFNAKDHLVQECAESLTYLFQAGDHGCDEHIMTWGLFIFGDTYGGGWVRTLPAANKTGVINSLQGAEESVALLINE